MALIDLSPDVEVLESLKAAPGNYLFEVTKTEIVHSDKMSPVDKEGNPQPQHFLKITSQFSVNNGEIQTDMGKTVTADKLPTISQSFFLNTKSQWVLRKFVEACGIAWPEQGGAGNFDTDNLIGCAFRGALEINDKGYMEIKKTAKV